jgi:hypothetical protein
VQLISWQVREGELKLNCLLRESTKNTFFTQTSVTKVVSQIFYLSGYEGNTPYKHALEMNMNNQHMNLIMKINMNIYTLYST